MTHTPMLAVFALVTFSNIAAHPATAQTILTGHHDSNPTGNGYDAIGPGSYLVPADRGTPDDATFNSNSKYGLYSYAVTVTVAGGQFDGNSLDGLFVNQGTVNIASGTFSNNTEYGLGAIASTVAVRGSTFSGNPFGIYTDASNVTVTGGTFTGNGVDFLLSSGGIELYGTFDGLSLGQIRTLSPSHPGDTTGSFRGQLEFASALQTFTYDFHNGGVLILHGVAPAPEPSSMFTLSLGLVSVLGLRARRRSVL